MPPISHQIVIFRSAVIIANAVASSATAGDLSEKSEIARLLAQGGVGFSIHRTERFMIASDAGDGSVKPLTQRLESAYQAVIRFGDEIKLPTHPPLHPLPVLLFNRHSDFERYARTIGYNDPAAPGFYHPRNNTAVFCNVLDLPQLREISHGIEQAEALQDQSLSPDRINEWRSQRDAIVETFSRLVIQHEAAHQVLFNTGVLSRDADNPEWLVEGLACQFEVVTKGGVNQMRLADFREALADRSDKGLLSLLDFVAADAFGATDESKRKFRYAQAWALVDYLQRLDADLIATYLRRMAGSTPRADRQHRINDFESVFGPLDRTFERRWIESVLALPFDPR